ncbi:MAG TPA: oxidoreductase, partial [Actinomycetota bacterium]|nr:oxidoreductase [Actinomycetota bacterium]
MKARVVRFVAPYRVELAEVGVPDPQDRDVLVRAEYSGISGGTELLAYRGDVDPELPLDETLGALGGTFAYPFAYGYSAVGTVEASGGTVPEGSTVF